MKIMLWYFPKSFFFPSGNFLTVQFPERPFPKSVLAAALNPSAVLAEALGPFAACGALEGLTLPLGSCRLGNSTFGKLLLGKLPLRKYLTP